MPTVTRLQSIGLWGLGKMPNNITADQSSFVLGSIVSPGALIIHRNENKVRILVLAQIYRIVDRLFAYCHWQNIRIVFCRDCQPIDMTTTIDHLYGLCTGHRDPAYDDHTDDPEYDDDHMNSVEDVDSDEQPIDFLDLIDGLAITNFSG